MTEREIRYCTTEDGVRIAYCVEGDGPPLAIVPAMFVAFSCDHLFPARQELVRALGQGRQIVQYDGRGSGLSQREVTDLSAPARMLDLKAVLRAARVRRASLLTNATGCLVTVRFAAAYPRKVDRLILYGALARTADVWDEAGIIAFADFCRARWDIATQTLADISGREEFPEAVRQMAEWYRQSTTGEMAARLVLADMSDDVSHLLPRIKTPALVIHRADNRTIPIEMGRRLALAMPNATFVTIPGAEDLLETDFGDAVEAIRRFLTGGQVGTAPIEKPAPGAFRTVLFTDLVGHTEMMSRLGDKQGREVLREHERITREVLKAHGGTEVKTMGDGFMASFGSVTKAVECAVALQRAIGNWKSEIGEPIAVRCGLNAGEPIEEEGDLFGATVILASRIAAKADGGEILVADTVRGLCSGKGFLFSDRGAFVAKGFEEPVRVYEVRWRDV